MKENNTNPIKLVIADDHEMLREGLRTLLKKQPGILLLGEAENGLELLSLCEKLRPDVVITDIQMPRMNGIEATRELHAKMPEISVIAYTMFDEENSIVDILDAGAAGYINKAAGKEEILEAIQSVQEFNMYYCKRTSRRLTGLIASSKIKHNRKPLDHNFNDRELAVIRMICEEKSSKEIAIALRLSSRTIDGYREMIQQKMRVKNTAGIVVNAIRTGLYKIY